MVTLFCAIVGEQGSAFSVDIDTNKSVDHLKKAIKAEKMYQFPADKLQLFLAKTDGAWLTEKDVKKGVKDTDGLTPLDVVGAPLNLVDLSEEDVRFRLTKDDVKAGKVPVHVLVVVPEQAQPHTKLWLVSGSIENVLNTKGIRCRVYRLAGLRLGCYDPAHRTQDKDVAFWYEDKTLCIHILFKTEEAAWLFENDLREGPLTLGSPFYGQTVITRVTQVKAVSTELQRVLYTDYDPQESDSPQNSMSSISLTTSVSNLDSSTDEFRYQRIEHEKFFLPYGKAESCHLVSRKQTRDHKREFAKYDRDPNNRLALSREMHGYYDGLSVEVPIVNMLPGSVEENRSIGNRHKVEVFVQVIDAQCTDRVFSRLKDGSTKTDDPLVMKTFVHVEDPETFCFCMRWKHDDNKERWRSFFDMTPAVD
ncbi:hypothetical protein V7S43_011851 [Phytophthora oleae]|uniref:Crinkler effector protein N-terminal domain-containing protein n=1 Tax=Phytophthora oleae TaxID=2107226 RepID=A0ABD3F827_9STRA